MPQLLVGEGDDPLVVDDTVSELDSAFSDSGSDTTSLTSSVLKYHYENGRRYHSYREGRYLFPNDEKEQDHMDILCHMYTMILDGKLFFAPIGDQPQRILDLGTGTGLWAIEVGDRFPSAQVIGNDLSPIQPQMVPPNVQFEVDDIESDWPYKSPFDFIHCRYMSTCIRDWPRLFQQAFEVDMLNFLIGILIFGLTMGLFKKEHDMLTNVLLYQEAGKKLGQEASPGPKLKKWAKDAGFVNIKEHVFKVPYGPWPKDRRLKEIGAWNQLQALEGMEGWTMALFCRVLGWSAEEVRVHLAKTRQDYRNPEIHAYATMHLVYGQKPKSQGN